MERSLNAWLTDRQNEGWIAEYLYNTSTHLYELGIRDADLEWLSSRVEELTGQNNA